MSPINDADTDPLLALRRQIDAIDGELLRLLNERARCAMTVAEVKQAAGSQTHFYRPEREAQVLRRIKARNTGPLGDEAVARLFREVISACMALEQTLTIAYAGEPGSPAQAAALKHFGQAVQSRACAGVGELLGALGDDADYGLLALDDLLDAAVAGGDTLAPLGAHGEETDLLLCGEVNLPTDSRYAAAGRFVVLGRQAVGPSGRDKTALLVSIADRPGEMLRLLEPLARFGVNMNCTAAPQPIADRGVFFIELDGHRGDAPVLSALEQLARQPETRLTLLGSYPESVL